MQEFTDQRLLMKRIAALIWFVWVSVASIAQEQTGGCQESLDKANSEFEAGRFYGLPSLLKPCLERGFTNEQRVRAYLILTQAYLILDDHIAAEDSYLKLLKADPEYVATPEKDPIDVVYLSKKFTATARFTPHFSGGANTSWTRVIWENNTNPYDDATSKFFFRPGFHVSAGIDWNITDNWSLCSGATLATRSFKKVYSKISQDDELDVIEKQTWLDVPIYIKYQKETGKIRPFAYGGYAFNLLLGYRVSLTGFDNKPSENGNQSVAEGADERLLSKRQFLNRSLIAGGGLKYKIGRDFLYVDLRYTAGLSNLVKGNLNAYDPSDNSVLDNDATTYRWVSDFFRMDNVGLSVGYIKPLYDPRKIRSTRASRFVNKILGKKK